MTLFPTPVRTLLVLLCIGSLACSASEPAVDETAAEKPMPAEESVLETGRVAVSDGTEVAYTLRGQGPMTLVLVHGWACDQTYWRHQVDAFAESYRVLTIDLPGHGLTPADRASWSLEGYGADLAAVVNTLDLDPVVLVGHSMGGPVSLAAVPQLGDRVLAVIGVETFHNAEFSVSPEQWQPLVDAYRHDYEGTCRQAVAGMFQRPSATASTTPESEELVLLQAEVEADMCAGPEDVGIALMAGFGNYRGGEPMARANVPIRALNAEYSSPTDVEVNRRYSPDFQVVTLGNVGHFLMLEDPDSFNKLFLAVLDEVVGQGAGLEAGANLSETPTA